MIKLIFCAVRRNGLTRSEFQDYWRNHHGPLFCQFASDYRALSYVQNHTLDTALNENIRRSRAMEQEYDGVGEICWESEDDFLAAIGSPQGQRLRTVFLDDEARFIDLQRSCAFFTEEHTLLAPTPRADAH